MMEVLEQWDVAAFRLLNGWNTSGLDAFMYLISTRWVWIPLYILIIGIIYRKEGWKGVLLLVGCWLLMILLSDQTASGLLKPLVERYRPCRPEAGLDFAVHTVYGECGGLYGFASSHAANFFAMAVFLSGVFQRKYITGIALTIAVITAYSRIYLGVHYPGDVLAGAFIGIIAGLLTTKLYLMLKKKFPPA
ncbi:MAG: phosphatase PAP2 family protein [Bacteroidia bacterium]|nr:phosphatase PAP2 family protein [Bacteroidia bacterium]